METTIQIPADGPDAVLIRLANLFSLSAGETQIRQTVASHPRPTSLLALVDVGGQIGLDMKPAKGNEAALEQQTLPVVVHFSPPDGRQGGFGIVEGITEDSVEIWDSAGGLRTVDRRDLLDLWSGVLIPVEAAPRVVAEDRPAPWRRALESVTGRSDPPAIVGGSSSALVRALFAASVALALSLSISSYPPSDRLLLSLMGLLSLGGIAIGGLMTVAVSDYAGPFAPGICRSGGLLDCQSVLTSRFAKLWGFPLSDIGIAFYSSILLTLAVGAGRPEAIVVAALATFAAVPAALLLIGIQISMKRLCALCLAVHTITLAAAIVAAAAWPSGAKAGDVAYMSLVFGSFLALVLLVAVPYAKDKKVLERLAGTHGRMFASPFASLAQLVTEQPTGLTGSEYGIEIGGPGDADELVAFVHPSCGQCEPVLREASSLAAAGRVNAYIAVPPRYPSERPLCRTLIAIALAHGPGSLARAYRVAKNRFEELSAADDPLPLLIEELQDAGVAIETTRIESAMDEAGSIVGRAEAFAADHVEGTPSVFLNSFPYRGPMAHLVPLLTDHTERLPRRSAVVQISDEEGLR